MEITKLKLRLNIQGDSKFVARNEKTVRTIVETGYFADLGLRAEDIGGWDYELTFKHKDRADLRSQVNELLADISSTADSFYCFIETDIEEPENFEMELWETENTPSQ